VRESTILLRQSFNTETRVMVLCIEKMGELESVS
jgi:hypothetical protein